MIKVCKFGGTSMADGTTIRRVREIAKDSTRRFLIVSAPGKRYGGEPKVTDLLYLAHHSLITEGSLGERFEKVKNRFRGIASELKIDASFDVEKLLFATEREIYQKSSEAFTVSRGEYLTARLMAEYMQIPFLDAKDVVRFDLEGNFLPETTYSTLSSALKGMERAVLPGFYGANDRGEIITFSRGGGDISGAIVARAVKADLYENWTDVSGFLVCDPRIVENPAKIDALTFEELQELARMGASVLHTESIFPVREAEIPIKIKNTFRPQDEGTLIIPSSKYKGGCPVTGITGKKNYRIDEASAQNFTFHRDGWELISAEPETVKIVFQEKAEGKRLETIALIAIVGQGIWQSVGAISRIFKAIAQAGVSVKLIHGANERKLLVGVENEDYERTIRAVYDEFYKDW